jgi:hypothetical protein
MTAYSSARVLLGVTVLGATGLGLSAGPAQALTTPCSFPTAGPYSICTSGPYESTPNADKVISEIVAPTAGTGLIDFTEEAGVGGGKSYRVNFDFNPPLTTPPGPISGSSQYKVSIDPTNPYYFNIASLSWSGTGAPTVTKEIYSAAFTPASLLATISIDGGQYTFTQNYKNIWIRDTYIVPNDGISNLDNFQNTFIQKTSIVPGPLPLLGAGMAFGFSRRLRRRSLRRISLG